MSALEKCGHLKRAALNGLNVGLSYYYGRYDDDDNHGISLLAVDLTYKIGPFTFLLEGVRADLDAGLSNRVVNGSRIPVPTKMEGFYAEAQYAFWPAFLNHTFLARDKPSFTLALRYDEIDTDDNRTTAGGIASACPLGLIFARNQKQC